MIFNYLNSRLYFMTFIKAWPVLSIYGSTQTLSLTEIQYLEFYSYLWEEEEENS